jgi:xanthine dehydrogenase accessory factor
MLQAGSGALADRRRLERIALGPSLGQCCGGVVFLCFERIDAESTALRTWQTLEQAWCSGNDRWRALPLDHDAPLQLLENDPSDLGLPPDVLVTRARPAGARRPGRRWLLDLCRAHQPQVVLFGAGHGGRHRQGLVQPALPGAVGG